MATVYVIKDLTSEDSDGGCSACCFKNGDFGCGDKPFELNCCADANDAGIEYSRAGYVALEGVEIHQLTNDELAAVGYSVCGACAMRDVECFPSGDHAPICVLPARRAGLDYLRSCFREVK